jgi:hypothetical protein
VLGSSLTVMSGYRFVLYAAELGLPVAIINHGPTRGDAKADIRIDAPLGSTLTTLTSLTLAATPLEDPALSRGVPAAPAPAAMDRPARQ